MASGVTSAVQDDAYGDTEQMRQIKAYIQEQVQLRVNAAIDQEAERQIELQMREFKEQYLREGVQRIPRNQNAAQMGRIPASVVMGRQRDSLAAGEKSDRAARVSRKDRVAGVPSNTLRRAESKKAASPYRYKK